MNHAATDNPIIALVGPTASGKSDLGIETALRFGGEIINCDSVQVYREIEIATAKVPPRERRGVPHHLIDFVPPHVRFTAGEWARLERELVEQAIAIPLVNPKEVTLLSKRVGNFQRHPVLGTLISQLWVR